MQTLLMLNQILRWLKRPKVLKLVCLASSVVGLLCYALSSSFSCLLGKWSWWKMLLYIVFSFIICLAVLFTPARSSSTSLRLEAHLAFLVLIITSIYSFLFDNVVKGKPDAYSLISCAAFATMSLGLSNLTQFGFQIDLLYFFCGGLTVQLMKIKLWLITVGAGFTYSLLQLRHHPRDTQGENLQLQNQNHVIIQVDDSGRISSSSPVIMEQQANADVGNTLGTSPEDGDLIQSNSTSQNGSVDYGLVVQQQLINCIKELEKVNQMLVPMVCSHVDKYLKAVFDSNDKDKDRIQMLEVPDPDVNLVMDALPFEIISRLKEIVKLIVEGGFTEECSDIYSKWRKEFVEQCRRALGLQFQTPNDEDVEKWLKTCKATSKILFLNESRLCDYLFSGLSVASDAFFDKVCKEVAFDPVSFVDTTMKTGNLLNILFNVPKILESLHELQLLFLSGRGSYVPDIKYVQYILVMLKELGNFIFPNNEQAPVINGGLHRITKKAMRYILDKSKHIRNSLFWMGRMIELLESQLESQSKDYYADPALGSVFMINNLMYIQQEAHDLKFDDDWFRQHTAKVIQSLELYLRSSWNKMVDFLKVETNELAEADMVAELMKEKLNLFNLHFEETCTIQSTWTISDKGVKELIIESIEEFLLPEYGEFYNRFLLVFGNQAYHYIKFGFEDIKSCLSHLFFLDDDFSSR